MGLCEWVFARVWPFDGAQGDMLFYLIFFGVCMLSFDGACQR